MIIFIWGTLYLKFGVLHCVEVRCSVGQCVAVRACRSVSCSIVSHTHTNTYAHICTHAHTHMRTRARALSLWLSLAFFLFFAFARARFLSPFLAFHVSFPLFPSPFLSFSLSLSTPLLSLPFSLSPPLPLILYLPPVLPLSSSPSLFLSLLPFLALSHTDTNTRRTQASAIKHQWGVYGQPMCDRCKHYCLDYTTISADLNYVLLEESSEKECFNGVRDKGRKRPGEEGGGTRLDDFMMMREAIETNLTRDQVSLSHTARHVTHCNAPQHTATHFKTRNTLQHNEPQCNTLLHAATHCNTLPRTATHCHTLPHTATHLSYW